MDLGAAGLREQPFRTHGRPSASVSYASYEEGLKVLEESCTQAHGLSLIQGPTLAGKTTLIHNFLETVPEDCAVAVVDGRDLDADNLLAAVLGEFGFALEGNSCNEMRGLLRVFVLQQAAHHEAPILVVENAHGLQSSGLRMMCELADLKYRGTSALKLVFSSDRPLLPLIQSPEMKPLAKRLTHDFHLRPMTYGETMHYVYSKLRAVGAEVPELIFPPTVCSELWRASGGWPGILDRVALLALADANALPVPASCIERPVVPQGTWQLLQKETKGYGLAEPPAPPTLFVTHEGETLDEIAFDLPRLLIGRSEHNDISINSRFVSRHHALLVRHGATTFLMDLNSTNGTFVNSQRVSNQVLMHDDIIMLGNHRIKFDDPHAVGRGAFEGVDMADTVIMKSLADMRRLLAQENTEVLPSISENLPTSGF